MPHPPHTALIGGSSESESDSEMPLSIWRAHAYMSQADSVPKDVAL